MDNLINLNTADLEELTHLPGIGPAMANRIVGARPYETVDDLRGVSGVGPALFERLQTLVTLVDAETQDDVIYLGTETETQTETDEDDISQELKIRSKKESVDHIPEESTHIVEAESEQEEGVEADEIIPKEKAIIPVKGEKTEKEPLPKKPKPVTWGQVFLIAAGCSFTAFILAVLLSLGIIGSLNNGLNYASTEQVQNLSRQIGGLDSQIGTLLEDIDSLRARLDNLESMTGRVGELETVAKQLADKIATTVEAVDEINAQITVIVDSNNRFQTFLNGLSELMNTLISEPKEVP